MRLLALILLLALPMGARAASIANGYGSGFASSSSAIDALYATCAEGEVVKVVSGNEECAADATGGTPDFSGIGAGTSTDDAMVVGDGSSLAVSGTGTIAATTAAALAANPSETGCGVGSGKKVTAIAADGTLTCEAMTSADIANLSVGIATAAVFASAADHFSEVKNLCSSPEVADGVLVTGDASCIALTDAYIPDDITIDSAGTASTASDLSCTDCINATEIEDLALGTSTTGNYVATITASDPLQSSAATTGEGTTHTLSVDANGINATHIDETAVYAWSGASTYTNGVFDGVDAGAGTTRSAENKLQICSHNTDPSAITDGTRGELCFEEDSNHLWVCEPTAGGCDTAGEWTDITGVIAGNPGGSDGYVQYNDNGAFGAESDFTYNATTNALTVAGEGTIATGDYVSEPGNGLEIKDNDTAFTNDPTCANSGTAGELTILDKDESAADSYVQCNGTTEVTEMFQPVIFCGQSFNTTTGYLGPGTGQLLGGVTDYTIGGTACDALESTTEATADAPLSADWPAFKVNGLYCRLSSDPASDVVVTARSATADLSPSLTCTIAGTGSATSCRTTISTTTDVAAGATVAVKVVTLEDLSTQDVWCRLYTVIR